MLSMKEILQPVYDLMDALFPPTPMDRIRLFTVRCMYALGNVIFIVLMPITILFGGMYYGIVGIAKTIINYQEEV